MREIVSKGYKCPLCPCCYGGRDIFFTSKIVGAPMCQACSCELSNLVDHDERPEDPLLDRLEELTKLTFMEYKKLSHEETIEEFERRLMPENIHQEAKEEIEITHRSFDEVISGWRNIIEHYRSELIKLNKANG